MKLSLLLLTLILASHLFADDSAQLEKDCSRAVVGFLKEKGVITGGDEGLCLSDLKSLPEIHIGMGAKTFPLGDADKFKVTQKTQDNLQSLRTLFMTDSKKETVSFTGYADGEQNNIEAFDARFLASGQTSFTKTDLKLKIQDPRSLQALLELLKGYKDTEKIPYDQSKPELKTAQSLIRNYFLARARAKKVCETTMEENMDCDKAPLEGMASPTLEVDGNKQCPARRKAFLTFNLAPTGMKKGKSALGQFGPSFETPNPRTYQRDLQIASSLDLFSKLAKQTGGTDLENYKKNVELVVPVECQQDPTLKANTLDNSRRLIDHIKENLASINDSSFLTAVKKGDYVFLKKRVTTLSAKKDVNKALTADEEAQMKVMETLTYGMDRSAPKFDLLSPNNSSMVSNVQTYELKKKGTSVKFAKFGTKQQYIAWDEKGAIHFFDNSSDLNTGLQYLNYEPNTTLGNLWKREGEKIGHTANSTSEYSFFVGDSKYPKASSANPSTDIFNCFSSAAGIEDNLQDSPGSLVEASTLASPEGDIKVNLNSHRISHLNNDPKGVQGWVCDKCHNGVQVQDGKLVYLPREPFYGGAAKASVSGQGQSSSLTMGSLKNLKVFDISRDSFGDSCSGSKTVCDCVKNIEPGHGQLEKVLGHESTQKMAMTQEKPIPYDSRNPKGPFKIEKKWNFIKPDDHCLFTPPVPHTCQVDPEGRSRENKANNRASILACKILDRLKEKYHLAAEIDINKYKNTPLGSSQCSKALPTSDEKADCGYAPKSSPSSTPAKATGQ